jgi:hypothetical protein
MLRQLSQAVSSQPSSVSEPETKIAIQNTQVHSSKLFASYDNSLLGQ